ncbi:ABC transporter substrate-binding protein [Actinomadura madurae]|uniref:ABC transporter substrate-binding protein n=1 Tax=Actinomadura madurae TaxID=1993 RepID=UPI002027133B|nr:ABC transporter substrate-binding protein [Actinomadura madurae]URN00863.1 ABC transporter substrate-binding protein [Actinomadura madurae]URN03012.1 ABC transporter substrate-binding protein [Actinomadura madurae]
MKRHLAWLGTGLLAAALAGCGSAGPEEGGRGSAGGHPVTVENCGVDVTLDRAPSRVMIVNSAPLQYLSSLGVLDRLASRAGKFPAEYYSEQTFAAVRRVPSLTDRLGSDGHLRISTESIIAEEPDLLLGLPEGVTRESLAATGIPVLLEPSFCPEGIEDPGYETIYGQMRLYGKVFGREAKAEQAVTDLRRRIETVEAGLPAQKGRKVAVLWPYRGEGTIGAYGGQSMATPQLETLGARNVFADVDKRVFEVSMEELLGRDPDVIVLLHTDGTDQEIKQALLDIPGARDLRAVKNDAITVQLFNFTEPPTPLVLDGLERLAAYLKER